MNSLKIKIYKRVLKDASEKYEGAEEFINGRIDEICSQEKLSVEELIYLLYIYICIFFFFFRFLAVKWFFNKKVQETFKA